MILPTQETHQKVLLKRRAKELGKTLKENKPISLLFARSQESRANKCAHYSLVAISRLAHDWDMSRSLLSPIHRLTSSSPMFAGLAPPEPELAPREAMKLLLTITIFRPIRMLVTEPIVLCYALYNGFTFSVLFVFLEAFPYVFSRVYFFNLWQIGLTFSSVGAGVLLGVILTILVDRCLYQKRLTRDEKGRVIPAPPEERLYVGMVSQVRYKIRPARSLEKSASPRVCTG